jgi:hypothetical protein
MVKQLWLITNLAHAIQSTLHQLLAKKTKTIVSDDEDFDQIREIKRTPLK